MHFLKTVTMFIFKILTLLGSQNLLDEGSTLRGKHDETAELFAGFTVFIIFDILQLNFLPNVCQSFINKTINC